MNEEVKVIICNACNRGVPVNMLNSHSKIHHPGRSTLSSEQLGEVMETLRNDGYRTSKDGRYCQPLHQKPIDGLEVLKGYLCPLTNGDGSPCHRAFLKQTTFTRHLSDHPGSKPGVSSCASYVQTIFSQGGALQSYFAVDPSLSRPDPSPASAYAYAVKMFHGLPQPTIPESDNDKDRASIHWFTRWPELLEPYISGRDSVSFLQSLVSFPESGSNPDWLTKLPDHGCRWWGKAEAAHSSCSWNASVMLKSHQQ